jgi:SNF2 family DNA or RNA helicase
MYAYQLEAIDWMRTREDDREGVSGGFLCHEMGLGKTHIMCKHIKDTIEDVRTTLILTTKSTLESWKSTLREYSQFEFDVKSAPDTVFHPTRPCVAVSTHHSVLHHFEWYMLQHFDRIVVDEAHIMRNQGKIFENLRELSRRCQYRWGITATPFNNRDSDMTAYVKFLKPTEDTVKGSDFKQYFIRKLRSEVIEGGPKLVMAKEVYDFEYPEERMMYDFVSNRIEETHDWIRTNAHRLPWRTRNNMMFVLMLRQRQASIHPQLVLNAEKVWARQMGESYEAVWDPLKVTKINKIAEMVDSDQKQGKNTLIITHFSEEIRMIAERLQENKVKIRILDGKTPVHKRTEIEKKLWYTDQDLSKVKEALPFCDDISRHILSYMQDIPEVVIIQIQAGGVGISLPWIHHVVNAAPDWNPFLEKQSIYRAYRVTTKHDVRVTSLYFKQTIELAIQKRQTEKMKRSIEWTDDPIESISEYIRMPQII